MYHRTIIGRVVCLIWPLFFHYTGFTQVVDQDSLIVMELIEKAQAGGDQAREYLTEAERLANSKFLKVKVSHELAYYFRDLNQMDSAIAAIDISFTLDFSNETNPAIQIENARSFYLKSGFLIALGDYQGALSILKQGYAILERHEIINPLTVNTLVNLGIDYWRIQDYQGSLKWLDKAIEMALDQNYEAELRRAYLMKGLDHYSLNQLRLAKEYYRHVFELIGDEIESNARDYMATCNNMGLAFQLEHVFDSALNYYEAGLTLIESGKIENQYTYLIPYYRSTFTMNIGYIALWQKQYEKGINNFLKAEEMALEKYHPDHPFLQEIYESLADGYVLIQDTVKAEYYFQRHLDIMKGSEMNESRGYNDLGDFYFNRGLYKEAALYYDSAIQVNNSVVVEGQEVFSLPDEFMWSLKGKSGLVIKKDTISLLDLDELLAKSKTTLYHANKNSSLTALLESSSQFYKNLYVGYDSLVYSKNGPSVAIERKWEIAQLSRANSLRSRLQDRYSLNYSLPQEILDRERELKDSIDAQLRNLHPSTIDSTLFILNRRYEAFIEQLERDYPKYSQLKNKNTLTSLEEERSKMRSNDIILHFFQAEYHLFVMKITQDEVISFSIEREKVEKMIAQFNDAIFDHSPEKLSQYSNEIRRIFLITANEIEGKEHMIIMPDGLVWKLDFAALLSFDESGERFMTEETTLSYRYLNDQEKRSTNISNDVLAFSYSDKKEQINPLKSGIRLRNITEELPGASKEVAAISKMWDGHYYYADLANETTFKEEGDKYGILHLAVHGVQDELFPENSFLKFHSKDSLNDGKLYAYELYNLNFNARLAVLSACNSGSGKVESGEGMMSMAHAFAYAGVDAIVASRWKVPDETAPIIMEGFYEGLMKGMNKSEALQFAQKKFLDKNSNSLRKSPFYWAGFYVLGKDDPIVSKPVRKRQFMILGAILITLWFGFIWRRKFRK